MGPPETGRNWKVIQEGSCGLQGCHCCPKQEEHCKEEGWDSPETLMMETTRYVPGHGGEKMKSLWLRE